MLKVQLPFAKPSRFLALTLGRPPTIQNSALDRVRLPDPKTADKPPSSPRIIDASCEFGFFYMRCKLIHILDDILERIYSNRDQQDNDVGSSVKQLALDVTMHFDSLLNEWEAELPEYLRTSGEGLDSSIPWAQQANILRQK